VAWLTVLGKSRRNCPDRESSAPEPAAASALRPHGITELGAMVAAIARRKDRLDQLVGEVENTGSAAPN